MLTNLNEKLNPSQLEAVNTIYGPLLVIAGAGSGKTRAIEYRVLNMVQNGINPESILLLTFTRKAAHEMLSRATKHDMRCNHVEGGTFHSFAFKILKKYSNVLGFSSQFSILDEGDSEDAIHKCASRLGIFENEKKFPKKNTLRAIISMAINKSIPICEIIEKEYPHFAEFTGLVEKLRKEYVAYKIQKNYMDYDDLLIYLKLLLERKELCDKISEKFKFVMIDEYQDTNRLQGDIACLLAKNHGNIMVVGDDAQSIYGFRGSSHKNIMEFPKKFNNCKIIKLEENYRSTESILNVANACLEEMTNKYSKCLISKRPDKGMKPAINYFKNTYDEAEWIVSKIIELRNEKTSLSNQAVLFRSAYISIYLQAELNKHNIPYEVYGGLKFYETAHVKDLISHLRVVRNPKDEIAWHRILMLIEGIGPKTADKISEEIMSETSLSEISEKVFKKYSPNKFFKGLMRLKNFLGSFQKKSLNPGDLYEAAFDYYKPILKEKFDDWHLRVSDLEALKQIASRYNLVEEFLEDFAIEPPERGVLKVNASLCHEERPLTLSTIHSAKGLEWDTIFLIGLVDGVLPISFSLNSEEEIEEERRLFYVAVTRAKNRLFLSLNHEGTRGGLTQFNRVSRFVDSPNILKHLDEAVVLDEEMGEDISLDDDIMPFYDKDTLLRDVLDSYDKV